MHYAIEARFKQETAADLLRKLTDGTVANQEPDGQEIVASMHRAVVGDDGVVHWSEVCYCPTPLEHERDTVYDQHFSQLETRVVDDYLTFEGRPFMAYLKEAAEA